MGGLQQVTSVGAQLGALAESGETTPETRSSRSIFVRVSFEVSVETGWGETVVLVGNTLTLGAWQPHRGVRMSTLDALYPVWRCEPLLLSEISEIEYKFVIIGPEGEVRWEPLLTNRKLLLDRGETQVIADWGSPSSLPSTVAVLPPVPLLPERPPTRSSHVSSLSGRSNSASMSSRVAMDGGLPTADDTATLLHDSGRGDMGGMGGSGSMGGSVSGAIAGAPSSRSLDEHERADRLVADRGGPLVERLLVVRQHLPVLLRMEKDDNGGGVRWSCTWDEWDLLATPAQGGRHLMGSLHIEVIFVGCLKQLVPPEEHAAVRQLLAPHNCVPVFISQDIYEAAFPGYAATVLWPIFHNQIPDRHAPGSNGDGEHVAKLFAGYSRATDAIAAVVKSLSRNGDMIWVHSHQLLLLPERLRANKLPANSVVSFFLHAPFPSPELWRVIPHRTELLNGMLGSHVVGFHLFEYARHFMTSCRRLLGQGENVAVGPAGGVLSIDLGSRRVTITVSHVGIDRDLIHHRLQLPGTTQFETQLRSSLPALGDRIVIGGVEKLSELQGTTLKLRAYEELLKNYPMWRSRVTLLQVCFGAGKSEMADEQSVEHRRIVARIRNAFGAETVHYLEVGTEIERDEWCVNARLAVFRMLDVFLNTAMKDGLNLLPFEYVLTKMEQNKNGVVVLSEFVGCSHVLNGGVRVNPFNLEHVVEQIDTALAMPPNERAARLAKDYKFVSENTTTSWLHVAVQDMRRVRSTTIHDEAQRPTLALASWPAGVKVGQPLPALSVSAMARCYRQCSRRLILLGLDGTLIQQEKVIAYLKNFQDFQGHSLSPPPAALHCLRALAADPLNTVYVISGRSALDMEACLGDIEGLGLAAELGFLQMAPQRGSRKWTQRELTGEQACWRQLARPVLEEFARRTNGAYIRWLDSAALWCYQNADPDFGRFQAGKLTAALRTKFTDAGVAVCHSPVKGQVEVRIAGVNKGVVADDVFCSVAATAPVDFVLAIGDDDEDEFMLSAVTARAASAPMRGSIRDCLYTVTVGHKAASHAQYTVEHSREVLRLLEMLRDGRGD